MKCFQAANGTEFVNNATTTYLASRGILLRLSCPYTSAQNGKAEWVVRTLDNSVRTLLLHAFMPPSYWVEALAAVCYLLNRRPSSAIGTEVPYTRLHGVPPTYDHLLVFGCLCYPNLQATSAHKLAPRSTACVFLGYPSSHKGYRCLDLSTRRIIVSRHVVFDESQISFAVTTPVSPSSSLDFLLDDDVVLVPFSTNTAGVSSWCHGRCCCNRPATPCCGTCRVWSRAPGMSSSYHFVPSTTRREWYSAFARSGALRRPSAERVRPCAPARCSSLL